MYFCFNSGSTVYLLDWKSVPQAMEPHGWFFTPDQEPLTKIVRFLIKKFTSIALLNNHVQTPS